MTAQTHMDFPCLKELLNDAVVKSPVGDLSIMGLCLDSRKAQPGSLFVALDGAQNKGSHFVASAVEKGAVAVLMDADTTEQEGQQVPVPILRIAHLRERLSSIADRFYGAPSRSMSVIGVTGTNGKTSCAQWLGQVARFCGIRSGIVGTLGFAMNDANAVFVSTGMTTPDAIQVQEILAYFKTQGARWSVMEVSSHGLDQHRVDAVRFETAVFTNLTQDHLDYHPSMAHYAQAKQKLFAMPGLRHAVINLDDHYGAQFADQLSVGIEKITYGIDNPAAILRAEQVELGESGIHAVIRSPWGEAELSSPIWGRYNLQNFLAVIGAATVSGVPFDQAVATIGLLRPVDGRLQSLSFGGIRAFVDYAHTPDAVAKVLSTVAQHTDGRCITVLGCGGDRDRSKRPFMAAAAELASHRLILTSDNPRHEDPQQIIDHMLAGLIHPELAEVVVDRKTAIERAIQMAEKGDVVLVLGKGHESYQLIKGESIPFSDISVVREALIRRGGA